MPFDKLDEAKNVLKLHLSAEAAGGFARLRRTPSTAAVQFLDYFATLPAGNRDALLEALAHLGALRFLPPPIPYEQMQSVAETNPAFLAYRRALQSPQFTLGLRYVEPRMRKALLTDPAGRATLAEARAGINFKPRDDAPAELTPKDGTDPSPAKAPLLRNLIDSALRNSFASGKQKLPGGETEYFGTLNGSEIRVNVDFGAMGMQLRYGMSIDDETNRTFVRRMCYEELWGIAPGWNYVTEQNAEVSAALLCDCVAQILSLRNAVLNVLR